MQKLAVCAGDKTYILDITLEIQQADDPSELDDVSGTFDDIEIGERVAEFVTESLNDAIAKDAAGESDINLDQMDRDGLLDVVDQFDLDIPCIDDLTDDELRDAIEAELDDEPGDDFDSMDLRDLRELRDAIDDRIDELT